MAEMRALQVTRHGQPGDVLAVRSLERPEPGPNEVRVKVSAASLNFNDIDRCRGNLVSVPTPPPFTLGMDVCGVVDAAGEGAEAWLGQRVVAITKNALGGIADYAIADAISVFDAPEQFDDAEATAFLLTFQTSHLALFKRGRLGPARPWSCTRPPAGSARRGSSSERPPVLASSPWPAARRREPSAPHLAQTWWSTTPPRTSSRRSSEPRAIRAPTWSTT